MAQLCNYLVLIILEKKFYPFIKSANSHFTVSYNTSLYRDTKVAIYRYTKIVYHYTSNVHTFYMDNVKLYDVIDHVPLRMLFFIILGPTVSMSVFALAYGRDLHDLKMYYTNDDVPGE